MFDNFENRAKNKIKASIQKYQSLNFNTEDSGVQASIRNGVYKTDKDFEQNTVEKLKAKYPDAAAKYPHLFKKTEEGAIFPYEEQNGVGAIKIQSGVILEKEGDQNLDKPSSERINTCLGYSN